MPKYQYKAISSSGSKVDGEYMAADQDTVVEMLRHGGLYPTEIQMVSDEPERVTNKKIKSKPLASFCQQMASMLRAGVPIAKTLEILKSQTENNSFRMILDDVYSKVLRGYSLYASFAPYRENFPVIFLSMIEAGEASGALEISMERAANTFTRNAKINGKIRAAMVYPLVLVVLIVLIVGMLMLFVIPSFVTLYEQNGADLPGITKALIGISDFLRTRWYIYLPIIAFIIFGIRTWLKSEEGRTTFDRWKLGMPVFGKVLNKVYAARYARTLSSLNTAGVPLLKGLDVVGRTIGNHYVELGLYKVAEAVNQGEELSAPLERMGTLRRLLCI